MATVASVAESILFFFLLLGTSSSEHPETEARKNRKQYRQLVNHSLIFVSVGAAVAIVGLAAYKVYASRKNTSS